MIFLRSVTVLGLIFASFMLVRHARASDLPPISLQEVGKRDGKVTGRTAVTLLSKGESRIILVATFHLGTAEYFAAMEKALQGCDEVWHEGTRDHKEAHANPDVMLRTYSVIASLMGVSTQAAMAYAPSWKRVDLDREVIDAQLAKDGLQFPPKALEEKFKMLETLQNSNLDAPTREAMRKQMFSKVLAGGRPNPDNLFPTASAEENRKYWAVLVEARNKHIQDELDRKLAAGHSGSLGLLYGARHAEAMVGHLLKWGYKVEKTTWFTYLEHENAAEKNVPGTPSPSDGTGIDKVSRELEAGERALEQGNFDAASGHFVRCLKLKPEGELLRRAREGLKSSLGLNIKELEKSLATIEAATQGQPPKESVEAVKKKLRDTLEAVKSVQQSIFKENTE